VHARFAGLAAPPPLPAPLLEALNHDPSAITGATRRLRGWAAVEDIHRRVGRQRAMLRCAVAVRVEPSHSARKV
jgi:hypothetical protein